jgi:hypothetical protein
LLEEALMEWFEIARAFGLPVALLLMLLFGLRQTVRWLAVNILKPLVDRHLALIDALEASLEKLAANQERLAERLDDLARLHELHGPH